MFRSIIFHILAPGAGLWYRGRKAAAAIVGISLPLTLILLSRLDFIFLGFGLKLLFGLWLLFWGIGLTLTWMLPSRKIAFEWSLGVFVVGFWCVTVTLFAQSKVLCGWQLYYIPSESMAPTLKTGQVVFADARPESLRRFYNGEILIFTQPQKKQIMIKRVAARVGDQVAVNNKALLINGAVKIANAKTAEKVTSTLNESELFMLGDNYDNSIDSRYWGVLNTQYVLAKYTATVF